MKEISEFIWCRKTQTAGPSKSIAVCMYHGCWCDAFEGRVGEFRERLERERRGQEWEIDLGVFEGSKQK